MRRKRDVIRQKIKDYVREYFTLNASTLQLPAIKTLLNDENWLYYDGDPYKAINREVYYYIIFL
jgi:hypothetical protein